MGGACGLYDGWPAFAGAKSITPAPPPTIYLFMHPSGVDLRVLAELIDARKLPVTIDRVFGFARIAETFAYPEAGHATGKVVVRME